ncbi:hypothetical protein MINS_31630 [Mycolicibacterium insubricum]|jgi:hypothetical protein|uniref:Uncharacterized protein n=1 Tax=Mycolicibacterium insubricum TaxID=444597 RepID=A0A1X0D4R5_9MYCO|nr:hypothetical protein [Mycolicibacterium insubricum]MCB9441289.1 hypothetical protein [Mycolicibacterium sp.]ORA67396.1 hypothetical protein BST26_15795 [Mycolicibacterium insubricum]BBZ67734.1 hypothetical protein MINS_31630 [Mycolicibacterium insubricum]
MPAPVLTASATVLCSHAGTATPVTPTPRVLLDGAPAVTISSPYAIAGCTLSATPTPPCVTGQWLSGAIRVSSAGQPLAVQAASSTSIPTGTPMLAVATQARVVAT